MGEWTETGGQWHQTSYWTNKYTGERTDEDPFKHNLPLAMKNKAALKRMESTDGARSLERESQPSTSYVLPYDPQPSSASSTLPYSPQPSALNALPYGYAPQPSAPNSLPYAPQPSASLAMPYAAQPSTSYGAPSLPPPSYSWATSAPVASPPQASTAWMPPPPITGSAPPTSSPTTPSTAPPTAPPSAPPLPSVSPPPQAPATDTQSGWIDPPSITMYNFGK